MTKGPTSERSDGGLALEEEISPDFMRFAYVDLTDFDDNALRGHYHAHGRSEGRTPSPHALRENLLKLVRAERSVLEIGPFYCPVVAGPNVRYFDVLNTDQLHARAQSIGETTQNIPTIDWVSPKGDLSVVDARFDAVVSSHAIEHQPDLVRHLQAVGELMNDGGRYYVMVPDKRYCFDHYIAESNLAEVVEAHHEKREMHALASVIEHLALTTHNFPDRHWNGDHGEHPTHAQMSDRVRGAIGYRKAAAGGYVDVHAWQFTPENFRRIMGDLEALELSPFEVLRVYDTPRGRNEFIAVLRKS